MFAKGPRFHPEKPSDVPGPGHYKLPDDSQYESYKKGAFLEKASRFSAQKDSDVPGTGTYDTTLKSNQARAGPSKLQPSNSALSNLQLQVEGLHAQIEKLEKENQMARRKYEEKFTHNENTIKSLVRDNLALQNQVSAQQRENSLVRQREIALKTALEKSEMANNSYSEQTRKYAALQRTLEELKNFHTDAKTKYQTEIEHLKNMYESSRKSAAEHSERSSMLKKQLDAAELKMKDLKKAIVGDQTEIRELRAKLREAEHARHQTKRKSDSDDKEAKFPQLEKNLAAEKRRREAAELQFREAQSQTAAQVKEVTERHRRLEAELESARRSAIQVESTIAEERAYTENLRGTLARVAEAYGNLATSSISRTVYREVQRQYASLHLRNVRLERRLADREAVTEQLTEYCRQASEEKVLLTAMLRDMEKHFEGSLREHAVIPADNSSEYISLLHLGLRAVEEVRQQSETVSLCEIRFSKTLNSLYRVKFEDLLFAYAVVHRESLEEGAVAARLVHALSEQQADATALRLECRTAEEVASQQRGDIARFTNRVHELENCLDDLRHERERLGNDLKRERESNARLIHTVQQSNENEEVLRSDIIALSEELQDAVRYKEAHSELLNEVVELIQRNELAEAEAEQLSKFNAEILGHTNPQQKILYVDRIRRELADAKHQLMKSTLNREDLMADNAALQHEVAAYKSISMSVERKPRIRVERALLPRNTNVSAQNIAFEVTAPDGERTDSSPMTLDEIM